MFGINFPGDYDYYRGLQLGINLYGGYKTELANFNVRMGGIHWYSMSAFTMKAFAGYNRYSLFQRNPWDPQPKDIDKRYSEYYERGAITQDGRWANQAFQGMILDITELPYGVNASIIYGHTQITSASIDIPDNNANTNTNNNYIKFFNSTAPNYSYGARFTKSFGDLEVGLNSFNDKSYQDLLLTQPIDNHVLTSDFYWPLKKLTLSG